MDILIDKVMLFDQAKKKTILGGIVIISSRIIDIYSGEPNVPLEKFERVIDAKGKFAFSGFFDVHSRCDLSMLSDTNRVSAVSQGILVEIIGQDGFSVAPVSKKNYMLHSQYVNTSLGNQHLKWRWKSVGEFLEALDNKISTNTLYYAPHGTLRLEVSSSSLLSLDAISALAYLFEKSIDDGAIGLSVSASKKPSSIGWDSVDEMAPLLAIMESRDLILNVSLEGVEDIVAEIDKSISLAREYGLRLHLSRLAANTEQEWETALSFLDKKRKDVKDLLVDVSPYTTSVITLLSMLPEKYKLLSAEEIRIKLRDKKNISDIVESFKNYEKFFEHMRLISTPDKELSKYLGWLIKNIATERDENIPDMLLNFLVFDIEKTYFEYDLIKPDVLEKAFSLPFIVPATSGFVNNRTVPDMFGAIPKYIVDFSKNDLSQISHKLATCPANFFKINWGIKKGAEANLIIMNPEDVKTYANLTNPNFKAEGVSLAVTNGKIIMENSKLSGAKSGRVLSWIK